MSPLLKEYLWSALITFVTAFVGVILTLPIPTDKAAVFALISVAVRAGFAAVLNLAATKGKTISSK